MVEELSISGILKGIKKTSGKRQNGDSWVRASLEIEQSDEYTKTLSTFDAEDIQISEKALNGEVKATYIKSKDGKYNNMIKGGLVVIGQGEAPITSQHEEVIKDVVSNKQSQIVNNVSTTTPPPPPSTPVQNKPAVQNYKGIEADKYELGMAKNNAAIIIGNMMSQQTVEVDSSGNLVDWQKMKTYYWQIVSSLYEEGKIVRQKELGY